MTLQDRDRPANPHPAVAGQPDFSGFVGPERKNGRPVMRHRRTGIAWGPSLELSFLPQNPKAGDLISGPDGARKVRFAVRGKGKSGGYHDSLVFAGGDIPVFLLNSMVEQINC